MAQKMTVELQDDLGGARRMRRCDSGGRDAPAGADRDASLLRPLRKLTEWSVQIPGSVAARGVRQIRRVGAQSVLIGEDFP